MRCRNSAPAFSKRGLQGITEEVPAIPQLIDRGNAGIRRFYENLERDLANQKYVAGDRFTIADITALTVVDFAGWVKQGIPDGNHHTKRWYEEVSKRPSMSA